MNHTSSNTNCSENDCYTTVEQEIIFIPEVQIIFLVLYGLVSIIGTIGNLFIVITVIRLLGRYSFNVPQKNGLVQFVGVEN